MLCVHHTDELVSEWIVQKSTHPRAMGYVYNGKLYLLVEEML